MSRVLFLVLLPGLLAACTSPAPPPEKELPVLDQECGAHSLRDCPEDRCEINCCPGDSGEGGCAGCCVAKPCNALPAALCPRDTCQVMTGCDGKPFCTYAFSAHPPACGEHGYYGQAAECCSGLVRRCGSVGADGSCVSGGGVGAICLACGDGTCQPPENRCSCPEDCR